jgi:hypothetical protein
VILFTYKYYHTSQTDILSSSTWANTLLRMRNGKALTTVFSSPTYFLPPLIEIHIGLAKLKGFVSFYFCIKFDHHSYDCFFLVFFLLILFLISSYSIWFNLIFILNLFLIVFIVIFLFWILFLINFFFNLTLQLFILFYFYVKFSPYSLFFVIFFYQLFFL